MEGSFHLFLKDIVIKELEKEGFDLYIEPFKIPLDSLMWNYFRPDILGIIHEQTLFKLVLVECETNPRRRRIERKTSNITQSLTYQKRLYEKHLFRLLLVIPRRMLNRINTIKIRKFWEIWIVNKNSRVIYKIPQLEHQQ